MVRQNPFRGTVSERPHDHIEYLEELINAELMSKSPKKKTKNLLRQILFQNRFFLTKSFAEETRVIRQELEKGRYAATERVFCSVAT